MGLRSRDEVNELIGVFDDVVEENEVAVWVGGVLGLMLGLNSVIGLIVGMLVGIIRSGNADRGSSSLPNLPTGKVLSSFNDPSELNDWESRMAGGGEKKGFCARWELVGVLKNGFLCPI